MRLFRRKRGARAQTGSQTETPATPGDHVSPEASDEQREAPSVPTPATEAEPERPDDVKGPLASTRAALAPVKKRHVFVASMGLVGLMGIGTLVFAGASFWWTSQPSFCDGCHVMEPYVAAWEQSSHADVNCESCHLTPGFFGFVGGKIAGLQVVANYIRGDYEDWSFNAAVSNAACLQCHEDITEASIHGPETGILVSHRDILEGGGKCMFCHSTVAHGSAVPSGSATHPTMDTCLTCHNDEIAPLDCNLCHVGKKPQEEMPTASPPIGTGG